MAEPPVARPPGGGDSRARRAARFPWLRTFLTVIVVIVLPAVVGYIWFSAVQTDAFERRDRQLLESMAAQLKSELSTTETILTLAPTAVVAHDADACDADGLRDARPEDEKRVRSYLAVSGRLELVDGSFPKRLPCETQAKPLKGCDLALVLGSGGARRLELRVTPGASGPACAFAGLRALQRIEEIAGFDRLRGEFDSVLVVTPDGSVIPGPGASQAATLRPELFDAKGRALPISALFGPGPAAPGAAPAAASRPSVAAAAPESLDAASASGDAALPAREWLGSSFAHLPRTRLLGVEYLTFAVPVKLQLGLGAPGNEVPLVLLGLVRKERFQAEAFALGPTTVSILATAVVAVLLSLPYVKIRFMGRRERLRRSDMALLATSIYFAAVLLTATLLHWGARSALLDEMDARMAELAKRVQHDVRSEVDAVIEQLGEAQTWPTAESGERNQILAYPLGPLSYPFFESIFVTDARGMQRRIFARRTSRVPPVALGSRQYFEAAMQAPTSTAVHVFDSVDGKPTGQEVAVFAAPIERVRPGATPDIGFHVPVEQRDGIVALVTVLRSLSEAVVPEPYRLVVVDADGHALFRSDGRRNRREDFFADLGEARPVLGFADACEGVPQSVRLLGRLQRMVLCSLDALPVAGSHQRPATLVVLYDVEGVEAQALDLFATVLFWGTLIGLGCALSLALCRLVDRSAFDAFWPTARRSRLYLVCSAVLGALAAAMIRGPWAPSAAGYALLAIPACVVLVLPVAVRLLGRVPGIAETHPDEPVRPLDRRLHPYAFIGFELALLCVVAIVPAVVVFEDAIEAQSLGRRSDGQQAFARDLAARVEEWDRDVLIVEERDATAPASDCARIAEPELAAHPECLFPRRTIVSRPHVDRMNAFRARAVVGNFIAMQLPRGSRIERQAVLGREHELCQERAWGIYAMREECRGRPLQRFEPVAPADCAAFFRLDRARIPHRFFSLVAQTCLPTGLDALLPIRRSSLAADAHLPIVPFDAVPPLPWPAMALAIAALVAGFGWLFASIARHILGLEFEGDGVLDRSIELEQQVAALARKTSALGGAVAIEAAPAAVRWLLVQPPAALRQALEALADVVRLDLLRTELVDGRIAEKPDTDDAVVLVDGLGARIDDPAWRPALLRFLSTVRCRALFVLSPVDPLLHLESLADCAEGDAAERARADVPLWAERMRDFERARFSARSEREARALLAAETQAGSPRRERRRLERLRRFVADETRWSDELFAIGRALVARRDFGLLDRAQIIEHLLDAAAPVYQASWSYCTEEERLLLHQIAREGLTNPRQTGVLLRLRRRHLVRATPRLRVMSDTFRRFVLEAVPPEEVMRWEQSHGESTAVRIRGPLLVLAGVAGILLVLTQQTLVTSTLGLAASAVGTVGALQAVLARSQAGRSWLSS